MERNANAGAGLFLAVGIIIGAFLIANALTDMRSNRAVTVKGLVEKPVRADYVSWPLTFIASGNELDDVYKQVNSAQQKITDFLLANGLSKEDTSVSQWRVVDQNAQEYGNSNGKDRFIIYAGVQVSTDKIDKVLELTTRTAELVAKGVVLNNSSASFRFNSLNSIKPGLLAEATKNARAAAEQFAKDSGSEVGNIARANQGVISILSKGSDMDDPSVPDKVVRVVTTIDYYLED
jgi:uncharacterized protein